MIFHSNSSAMGTTATVAAAVSFLLGILITILMRPIPQLSCPACPVPQPCPACPARPACPTCTACPACPSASPDPSPPPSSTPARLPVPCHFATCRAGPCMWLNGHCVESPYYEQPDTTLPGDARCLTDAEPSPIPTGFAAAELSESERSFLQQQGPSWRTDPLLVEEKGIPLFRRAEHNTTACRKHTPPFCAMSCVLSVVLGSPHGPAKMARLESAFAK